MTTIKPIDIRFFDPFNEEVCDLCGECLVHCPIMEFSVEDSKNEMKKLIAGEGTEQVLKKCQSCFTCNFYCPTDAHPANLILKRWNEQYEKNGLKKRAEYYITHYPYYPNFRTYVIDHMPENAKKILEKWKNLSPVEDTLTYPGCNIITFPELTQASFFKNLDIRGRLEYCCGETLFRTGYIDQLKQVAKRLDKWFNTLKPKNLLVLCTAGTNVFKNILPYYGLTYKFESIKSYIQYLWERIESGKIQIKEKLDMTVTIQESCYSKMFGDEYMDIPRKILNAIGVKIIETDACREKMRCCGIGGGFSISSAYHPMNLIKSGFRNIRDFKKTKADAICVYCAGCLATLSTVQKLYVKKKMKIYHIIELLQMAIGEKPISKKIKKKRARHFFWGIIKKQFPKMLSKKTFKMVEIPEDPHPEGY